MLDAPSSSVGWSLLVPVLLGVSLVSFTLVRLIPGDATMLAIGVDQRITPEQRELVRKSYGLDQPQPVQYVRWMGHVLQGDLGNVAAHAALGQRGAAAAAAGDDRADAAGRAVWRLSRRWRSACWRRCGATRRSTTRPRS